MLPFLPLNKDTYRYASSLTYLKKHVLYFSLVMCASLMTIYTLSCYGNIVNLTDRKTGSLLAFWDYTFQNLASAKTIQKRIAN